MTAEDGSGDEVGDFGCIVAALLDEVQSVEAQLLARGLFFGGSFAVPMRGACVEVPAAEVDALAVAHKFSEERVDFGGRFFLYMQEANHNVSDLDTGVVNVVLHVDFVAGRAEQAYKGVAENGVAQMADVRGLVGIDGGVLNEDVALL